MLGWNEVMPYNAVHLIEVSDDYKEQGLRRAISGSLESAGFAARPEALSLRLFDSDNQPTEAIRAAFEEELNEKFTQTADELPFRFIASRVDTEKFLLGVCYFHPVASADCLCWLLEDIVDRLLNPEAPRAIPWSTPRSSRYRNMFAREWRHFTSWLTSIMPFSKMVKRYTRLHGSHAKGAKSRVHSLTLTTQQVDWIRSQMKNTGATFNDILMGLALHGIAKEIPDRLTHPSRSDLAIGSIINIRHHFAERYKRSFGLYLAMFSVSAPLAVADDVEEVFRKITAQTTEIKEKAFYLRNLFILSFGTFWRRFLDEEQRANINLKGFPLAASITYFFVDQFQTRMNELPVTRYLRAVSASPSTPLVISVTSFNQKTHLMFIRNDSLYSGEEIDGVIERIGELTSRG